MARWLRVDDARKYAGGVSRKLIYSAVRAGKLKAAKIGAGRNYVFAESYLDEWLSSSAEAAEPRVIEIRKKSA